MPHFVTTSLALIEIHVAMQGEPFARVKERIQKRLDVPDKDFEKVDCSPKKANFGAYDSFVYYVVTKVVRLIAIILISLLCLVSVCGCGVV